VGINEPSPDYKLHVNSGTTNVAAKFESTDSTSVIQFVDNTGNSEFGTTGSTARISPAGSYAVLEASQSSVVINNASQDVDFRVESNNNANMLFVDGGNDRVGIGTASPSEKLHVQGDGADILITDAGGGEMAKLGSTGSNNGLLELKNSSHASTIFLNTSGDSYLNGGNVGIGTTSPTAKMHVYTAGAEGINIGLQNSERYWKMETDGGNLTFNDVSAGDLARLTINTSGNIGIGGPPSFALDVLTGGQQQLRVQGSGEGYTQGAIVIQSHASAGTPSYRGQGIYLDNRGSNATWYIGTPYSSGDLFTINRKGSTSSFDSGAAYINASHATNFFTITNAGKVGIGTTSPSTDLHIEGANDDTYGQLRVSSPSNGDAQITFGTTINGRGMYVDDSDTNKFKIYTGHGKGVAGREFTIDNSGNVGIGTTSPGELLDIYRIDAGDAGLKLKASSGGNAIIKLDNATANRASQIAFYEQGTHQGQIYYDHGTSQQMEFSVGGAHASHVELEIDESYIKVAGGIKFKNNQTTELSGTDYSDVAVKHAYYQYVITSGDITNGYADVNHKVYRDNYIGHTISLFDVTANVVYTGIKADSWITNTDRYASGDITRCFFGSSVAAGDKVRLVVFWHSNYG
jgi:hypothetical protein